MAKGAAIALGNFDGLHAGHRAVIEGARESAKFLGTTLAVATFEPAPRRHFQPDAPPFRLMTPAQRQIGLYRLDVAELHLLRFDGVMAAMTDREFCERVLLGEVGARSVSVGFDFRFGKDRMGDAASLLRIAGELGFEANIIPEVRQGGEKVSSSRIRQAIERGDMDEAARGLGGVWTFDGVVEHGEKRGRTLGYPTANMRLGEIVHPSDGVYAVWARPEGDPVWRPGVASFGRTPTTGLRDPLLEVVIFDWSGDLYGKRLHTAFVSFLRGQQVFSGLDELVSAMKRDDAAARRILSAATPPPA